MTGRALAVTVGWRALAVGIGVTLGVMYATFIGCHGS